MILQNPVSKDGLKAYQLESRASVRVCHGSHFCASTSILISACSSGKGTLVSLGLSEKHTPESTGRSGSRTEAAPSLLLASAYQQQRSYM